MSWKLIALSEPIEGQILQIDRDMVIGRHQQADIVLQAAHVSRRHAALILKDTQLWIQDLGSSNGTFVNGQKVTEQQLHADDEINFEAIRFRIAHDVADSVGADLAPTLDTEKVIPADEGMRSLTERAADIQVSSEGMPTNVGVPKPAPIPEHIDIHNIQPEPTATPVAESKPENRVDQVVTEQKNAKVGLISFVVLIILVIIALIAFGSP